MLPHLKAHKHTRGVYLASVWVLHRQVSSVNYECDGAVDCLWTAAFCKCKQEVHHLPYLGQLCNPLTKLSCISLIALDRCVWGITQRSPENPGGFQQLTCHQVGEVRRPELRGGRDGEAPWLCQPHRPVWESKGLFWEVQSIHSLVGLQQTLALLPLLAALLQRLNPQAHHFRQLGVQPEGQLHLCRHAVSVHCRGGLDQQLCQIKVFLLFLCRVTWLFLQTATVGLWACLWGNDSRGWVLHRSTDEPGENKI